MAIKPKTKKKQRAKYTLRNTFIRGPPYNDYEKHKKKHTKKQPVKIDAQKYVYQGSPPIMHIKTKKPKKRQTRLTEIR